MCIVNRRSKEGALPHAAHGFNTKKRHEILTEAMLRLMLTITTTTEFGEGGFVGVCS